MKYKTIIVGEMQTNCYIIFDEEKKYGVLIDPGDDAGKIRTTLEKSGILPEMILLTHGHFDHIGAAKELSDGFGIPVAAGEKEKEVLAGPDKNLSRVFAGKELSLKPDRVFCDGEKFTLPKSGLSFCVIHTPGHTEGGISFYLKENGLLFPGDTLFRDSYGRTDFPTGDEETLFRSIREKLLTLPSGTKVFPGHGFPTDIGHEKMNFCVPFLA